jgi:hypothetical protein
MVRTFLKVYVELGSSFLFLQEQPIKDIIIIRPWAGAHTAALRVEQRESPESHSLEGTTSGVFEKVDASPV